MASHLWCGFPTSCYISFKFVYALYAKQQRNSSDLSNYILAFCLTPLCAARRGCYISDLRLDGVCDGALCAIINWCCPAQQAIWGVRRDYARIPIIAYVHVPLFVFLKGMKLHIYMMSRWAITSADGLLVRIFPSRAARCARLYRSSRYMILRYNGLNYNLMNRWKLMRVVLGVITWYNLVIIDFLLRLSRIRFFICGWFFVFLFVHYLIQYNIHKLCW